MKQKPIDFDKIQHQVDTIVGHPRISKEHARIFEEGYTAGWDDRGCAQSGHLEQMKATNPYEMTTD